MRKIAGSGSIGQRHGSADPDPDPDTHQNAMDPQHCLSRWSATEWSLCYQENGRLSSCLQWTDLSDWSLLFCWISVLHLDTFVGPLHFGMDPNSRIRASDQWIRIRIMLFSSLTFKTPTKNYCQIFSAFYFLKVHLHHFSKVKIHKEVKNGRNQGFSYYFAC
jgi:hypothetical protein